MLFARRRDQRDSVDTLHDTTRVAAAWRDLAFICPVCRQPCRMLSDAVACPGCGRTYPVLDGVPHMVPPLEGVKAEIERFWSGGVLERQERGETAYSTDNPDRLLSYLREVESKYSSDGLFSSELKLSEVQGKRVLEIGCGSGGASLVMCQHGARVVAGDLSPLRARNAARLHRLTPLNDRFFVGVQLDAERLPFPDGFFDGIVSNGVLHHTADTAQAIREVHRVLAPGGVAAVMLYARRSLMYWGLLAYHGVAKGRLWRDRAWLSHVSEQSDIHEGTCNPVTRVYRAAEVRALFAPFRQVEIRQARLAIFSSTRFRFLTKTLRPLAPWFGWCLYIRAEK